MYPGNSQHCATPLALPWGCWWFSGAGPGHLVSVPATLTDGCVFLMSFPCLPGISEEMLTFSSSFGFIETRKMYLFQFFFLLLTWKIPYLARGQDSFTVNDLGTLSQCLSS